MRNLRELKAYILSDLYRYYGKTSLKIFLTAYFSIPGFKYMFWYRLANFFKERNKIHCLWSRYRLRQYSYRYGIQIPYSSQIGKGFYIGHFGEIIISVDAVIGKNVNISQGVTIGQSYRGANKGTPTLGDEIYIGPGAKIIGNIRVGNNVAIGANAVITKDIPDNAVVVGIPGRVISMDGASGYINNIV